VSDVLGGAVRRFLTDQSVGTIVTLRSDGRARQTLVYYLLEGDRVVISTEASRGKARDVEREPWASLCVMGHEKPWPSCTVEGPAQLLRKDVGAATASMLEKITGKRPDPAPTDEQLAAAGRVILALEIARVYGVSYID